MASRQVGARVVSSVGDLVVLGSNSGWAGLLSSYHLIHVCVNYDLNGSLHIYSRLHARLNNQISHTSLDRLEG